MSERQVGILDEELICRVCEIKINPKRPYYHEEITRWVGNDGESYDYYYHNNCYERSRR